MRVQHIATAVPFCLAFLGYLMGLGGVSAVQAAPYTLTNGNNNGELTVGVDGFGSFGSSVGSHATNATIDRIGAGDIGTVYESALAIRIAPDDTYHYLTSGDIGGDGGLPNPMVDGSSTKAYSTFTYGGLTFFLYQELSDVDDPGTAASQDGTLLDQVYVIVNTTASVIDFELIRYIDVDIGDFDDDGGGGIEMGGIFGQMLFTNGPNGQPDPDDVAVYVGITANSESDPVTDRFETRFYPDLRDDFINVADYTLSDAVQGDFDMNGFQDFDDDITMALRNVFSLAPGEVAYYTTKTLWGGGANSPQEAVTAGLFGTPTVPEPGALGLMGGGVFAVGFLARRRLKGRPAHAM